MTSVMTAGAARFAGLQQSASTPGWGRLHLKALPARPAHRCQPLQARCTPRLQCTVVLGARASWAWAAQGLGRTVEEQQVAPPVLQGQLGGVWPSPQLQEAGTGMQLMTARPELQALCKLTGVCSLAEQGMPSHRRRRQGLCDAAGRAAARQVRRAAQASWQSAQCHTCMTASAGRSQ